MNKPAIMQATYVDAKFMPGLKVMRIALDLPIERSNEFLAMFGAPDRASPVWCAVARLQPAEPLAEGAQAPERSEPKPYKRSQIAYLKFRDGEFIKWFSQTHLKGVGVDRTNGYEPHIKKFLGIESKSELDVPGPAAEAFDRLLTSFEYRDRT